MSRVVIDTNVIVSALLVPESRPADVLASVLNHRHTICYDSRIIVEYEDVLSRKKFPFRKRDIESLLFMLIQDGDVIVAEPTKATFADETDRKFFEVAQAAGAVLITGNLKHYPKSSTILAPAEFLAQQ